MKTNPAKEHLLYQGDKTLWAILLFMKYTHKIPRWEQCRAVIQAELTEHESEELRQCWLTAKKEKRV